MKSLCFKPCFTMFKACLLIMLNDCKIMFKPLVTSFGQANFYVHIKSKGNHVAKDCVVERSRPM